jgi:hypothetical protein
MIDGALVLPEVSVGMIRGIGDAQPRQAADTKLVVDHRHRGTSPEETGNVPCPNV